MRSVAEQIADALDRFDLGTGDPRWSSWTLERFVATVLEEDRATMTDLIRGLDHYLRHQDVPLTEAVATFIRDLTVIGFVMRGDWWVGADWGWATEDFAGGVGAARAYLFLRVLPWQGMIPSPVPAIVRALEGSCRSGEAMAALADEPASWEETMHLLRSPANARRLLTALARAEGRHTCGREVSS